jgi:hypothetical protein
MLGKSEYRTPFFAYVIAPKYYSTSSLEAAATLGGGV